MNQLPCPHCGWRNLNEFRYGGELRSRPDSDGLTDSKLSDYLYTRANPAGVVREWWYHRSGCGAWFVAERHTKTHAIHGVRLSDRTQEG